MNRFLIIRTASIIAIVGNLVLSVAKIIIGVFSNSLSVLGDGLDSLGDVVISTIALITSFIMNKPPDKNFPYGYYRSETIATAVLAFFMFFVGGQLSIATVEKVIYHDYSQPPGILAVYVTVLSIVGKLLLALTQFLLGKRANSQMIIANGKNMVNDILISSGVLIGLFSVYYFDFPLIDRILAVLIGVWIMISAVRIFAGTVKEVMEGESNMELYDMLFSQIKKYKCFHNPHRVRIRKLGAYHLIEFDVEASENCTIKEAHDYAVKLEYDIKTSIPTVYDIFIHIEPLGNYEQHERWGLDEGELPRS